MKKHTLYLLLGLYSMALTPTLKAQATGNETWNDNNRFKNSGYYRSESMSAPASAGRYDDAEIMSQNSAAVAYKSNKRKMANNNYQYYQAGIETSQGDLLLNQVQKQPK